MEDKQLIVPASEVLEYLNVTKQRVDEIIAYMGKMSEEINVIVTALELRAREIETNKETVENG